MTYTFSGFAVPILPDSSDVISLVSIIVPRALKMTKVTAQVQLQYPNSGDLKVYLYSPEGTRTVLLEHDCNVVNVDTTFDDTAQQLWKEFCPAQAGQGPFRPDQPLSNFNGDDSSFGTWILAVENDSSDSRSGWLTQFSLTITGTVQLNPVTQSKAIVNHAGLTGAGMIAPGEMTSIYGAGIGPSTGVAAPSGALPTSLGGTSVTVNGTMAPLAYVSSYRVDFQAPFDISPGSTATLQVTANGQTSGPVTLNVVDAVPGLYTVSPFGDGQATAVNLDGSTNSMLKPVPKGGVITAYASGLGAVNPALTAGAVPPVNPLSLVTGSIEAYIGGMPAPILFAGAAPNFPGLYQLNIQVPTIVPSGNAEILIYVNGKSSQKSATVAIQ